MNITVQRLHALQLRTPGFETPAEVVQYLGAVQSQEFAGAKWAVGVRLKNATDAIVEQAFAEGSILRTHVLRPTWHFVAPSDIRWMLQLTAPRVNAVCAAYNRRFGLDQTFFTKSNKLLAKALEGRRYLTRPEMMEILKKAKMAVDESSAQFITMRAELDGIICSGPRRGKQLTYALLEERVPPVAALSRDEALGALTKRYFTGHGPATVADYVWWSGLTMADAKRGLAIAGTALRQEVLDGQTYWLGKDIPPAKGETAYLLPAYDEYMVGYKDRDMIVDARHLHLVSRGNALFSPQIIINGCSVGIWQRTFQKDKVIVTVSPFAPLNQTQQQKVATTARRYARFLGMEMKLEGLGG